MLLKFIAYFSILNLIFFSVFLLFRKEARKSGTWIFSISMLIVAYTQWIVLLFYTGEIKQFYFLAYSEGIVFYLFVPTFYLYILKLLGTLPKLTIKHLVHLLPAVPGLVFYIVYITGSPEMRNYSIESKYCGFLPDALLNIIGVSIQIFYIILSFKRLNELKKIIRNNFSNYKQTEIRWVYFLLFAFVIISASYLLFIGILNDKKQVDLFTLLSLDCLFFAIFIKNMIYSSGIVPIVEGANELEKNQLSTVNNKSMIMSEAESNRLNNDLMKLMKDKEVFLNPDISLASLASLLDTTPHKLSYFLNQKLNTSFFDYINYHRIKKAEEILNNKLNERPKLNVIAEECGFKSRSSFYTSFKKVTGSSPTQFENRKSLQLS